MWKFIKGEKAFNRWHKKNLITYPRAPKGYPCIVIKKIDPDESTSNHVLYAEDIQDMMKRFITFFRGKSAIADKVLSWGGTPEKSLMKYHPWKLSSAKPPEPCKHSMVVNGICNWCKARVKI